MNSRVKTQVKLWSVSFLASFLLVLFGYHAGQAGDCKPNEIDGQCGLSTCAGLFFGVLAAFILLVCTSAYSIFRLYRDERKEESE